MSYSFARKHLPVYSNSRGQGRNRQMKLRAKFIGTFLLTTIFLLLSVGVGTYVTSQLRETSSFVTKDVSAALTALNNVRAAITHLEHHSIFIARLRHQSPESALVVNFQGGAKEIAELRRSVNEYSRLSAAGSLSSAPASELNRSSEQLLLLHTELHQLDLTESDSKLIKDREALIHKFKESSDRLIRVVDLAIQTEVDLTIQRGKTKEGYVERMSSLYYMIAIISMLVACSLGVLFASRLASPILKMRKTVGLIGEGDLSARIDHDSADEIGELANEINLMAENLSSTTISKKFLNRVFQSIPDAVFVYDFDGRITTLNNQAMALLGCSEEELLGQKLTDLVHQVERSEQMSPNDADNAVDTRHRFAVVQNKLGENIQVQITESSLTRRLGTEDGTLCIIKDIREQRRLESELENYKEQLHRSEQLASLGTISAIIAHKLNQPLTSIRLFLQQCLKENERNYNSDLLENNLHESLSELERADETIKDILYVVRQPKQTPDDRFSIATVAEKVIRALNEQLSRAKLQVRYSGLSELPDILAQPGELDAVFFFLIQNAIHAAQEQSVSAELEIQGDQSTEGIRLSFRDTCGGIAEDNIDKIFEMFFTTKPEGRGTGLGLPIVQQVIQRIGGSLTVETTQGVGSCFYVTLPTNT